MSVSASQLRDLMALGIEGEQLLAVLEIMERDAPVTTRHDVRHDAPSREAERARKYREKQRAARNSNVTTPVTTQEETTIYNSPLGKKLSEKEGRKERKEARAKRKQGVTLPLDWKLSDFERDYGKARGLDDSDLADEQDDIIAWGRSNEHRPQGRKTNWHLFTLAWLRRAAKNKKRSQKHGTTTTTTTTTPTQVVPPDMVRIMRESPEWPAFAAIHRQRKGCDPPVNRDGAWLFPKEYEPARSAMQEAAE